MDEMVALHSLKSHFKKIHVHHYNTRKMSTLYCSICLEKGETEYIYLPCGHSFHLSCLYEYILYLLQYSRLRNLYLRCPYCRNEFYV